MKAKLIFPLLFNLFLFSRVNCVDPYIECVDLHSDAESLKWRSLPTYKYAETSDELPNEFKGKLNGQGIFYFSGEDGERNQAFFKPPATNLQTPSFLYLKYYGLTSHPESIYITPAKLADPTFLPPSDNFVWDHASVEVDVSAGLYPDFGAVYLKKGEVLLIERFAIVSGSNLTVEEIEGLCQWQDVEPTTTEEGSTSEPPKMTTTNPPHDDDSGLSTYKILLYFVAPGVALLLIAILVMFCCKRRRTFTRQLNRNV